MLCKNEKKMIKMYCWGPAIVDHNNVEGELGRIRMIQQIEDMGVALYLSSL